MKIQTDTRDGVVVIKPMGSIIGPASNQFRYAIIDELKGITDSPNFLFDFASVPRIDSVGIGVLVGLHVSITQRGGQVGVINLSKSIRSSLVMSKLITTFKHFNTECEAIVNLRAY
jgi:anti-sigma B factor antagonist